jgi:prefoldin subunit 5
MNKILKHKSRWHNPEVQAAKESKVKDEDVMISTSIKDLEAMLEGVEEHTTTKFEKMFIPALIVFSLLALGGFIIIYSITTDMARLANSMDSDMGSHMERMTVSVEQLSGSVAQMSDNVNNMNQTFNAVDDKLGKVVVKLDNLDLIEHHIAKIEQDLDTMKPMLNNMNHMNDSMKDMKDAMQRMDQNIFMLRDSFQGPMNKINSMPFM